MKKFNDTWSWVVRSMTIGLYISALSGQPASGQTAEEIQGIRQETNVARLLQLSTEWSQRYYAAHKAALEAARTNGWITRAVLPDGSVIELQKLDPSGSPLYFEHHNLNAAKTVSTSWLWNNGGLGLNLTGTGITLRQWDEGKVLANHQELSGRVSNLDGGTNSDHSTHVAGTMIASGVNAAAKGMAPAATVRAFNWSNDIAEMSSEASAGMLLSNSSYGTVCGWYWTGSAWAWAGNSSVSPVQDYKFGFYDIECEDVDDIVFLAPFYLPCKSAGNDRGDYNGTGPQEPDGGTDGFDCVGSMGNAKNILTVGAVYDLPNGYSSPGSVIPADFTSWGPTDDGRIKPDIVANGIELFSTSPASTSAYQSMSGTSMSTPSTCGSLALLQQHYNTLNGVYMKASTLKALVIHTADECGTNPGPDYSYGWGLLNTASAAQVITGKNINSKIVEASLANAGTYTLNVNSAGNEPLRVTICWTDRKGTSPPLSLNPTTLMLVNDLDLRLDGTYQPWILNPSSPASAATTGDNFRDNIEQVIVGNPSAGSHTITVTHKGTLTGGSQDFSVIVTGISTGVADPYPFASAANGAFQIDLSWTKNPANNDVVVATSPTGAFGTPSNGTTYSAGNTIPGGGTVLYAGPAASFQHTGLTSNTGYHYKIWSVNGSAQYSYGKRTYCVTECSVYNSYPITENFGASMNLPSCWSQQSTSGASDWSISTSNSAGGTANELMAVWSNYNPATTRAKTFFFNTIGATTLTLSFNHFFDDFGAGCTGKIQTSTDGVNWTDAGWSFNSGSGNIGPVQATVTLTTSLNSPTTMVAFVLTGNLYNFDYWYIDNVTIKAPGYWVGGTAGNLNDWNTATNWGDGLVPGASTNVVIPPRTYLPVITNDPASPAQCNHMLIVGSSTVTVNTGKKLVVNGNVTMQN